jgi:trans-aconitate 2-methyltransferase
MEPNYSWDAMTYDKVSIDVQLEWGKRLVDERKWAGNEIVMDAGAGSGNLTKIVANKVPNGFVYAVDSDPNMVQQATANLSDCQNVKVIHSLMQDVKLPRAVDVIFSNAAIHWVLDQPVLFHHFWQLLKPYGELVAEFGGHGNLQRILPLVFKIMQSDPFKDYFANWKQPWHFPTVDEAESMLKNAGFKNMQVRLFEQPMTFSDRQRFAMFVKTVIIKPFFAFLPTEPVRNRFLDIFLNQVECSGLAWSLDYVRIGIFAIK